ncbi:MAG: hypothetical protein KBC64_02415 [Simkaniaceae bacterium]|nr:hypothetical protein [Simkaniaceae bacterium]
MLDYLFNPFDRLLKSHQPKNLLVVWNRGMGDVPLGLYALVKRVRERCPGAEITFITRPDLAEVFSMLDSVKVIVEKGWKRGEPASLSPEVTASFDLVLEGVNPTKWFRWQLGKVIPELRWEDKWDSLADKFPLKKGIPYLGAHLSTETGGFYRYEKNWPLPYWEEVIQKSPHPVILFGHKKEGTFPNTIDLRGETSLIEMLSIIKNRCRYLLAPDSGVLSVVYYVKSHFPLKIISLWADPKQGILRQKVSSPNRNLEHIPLVGKKGDVSKIMPQEVREALFL